MSSSESRVMNGRLWRGPQMSSSEGGVMNGRLWGGSLMSSSESQGVMNRQPWRGSLVSRDISRGVIICTWSNIKLNGKPCLAPKNKNNWWLLCWVLPWNTVWKENCIYIQIPVALFMLNKLQQLPLQGLVKALIQSNALWMISTGDIILHFCQSSKLIIHLKNK